MREMCMVGGSLTFAVGKEELHRLYAKASALLQTQHEYLGCRAPLGHASSPSALALRLLPRHWAVSPSASGVLGLGTRCFPLGLSTRTSPSILGCFLRPRPQLPSALPPAPKYYLGPPATSSGLLLPSPTPQPLLPTLTPRQPLGPTLPWPSPPAPESPSVSAPDARAPLGHAGCRASLRHELPSFSSAPAPMASASCQACLGHAGDYNQCSAVP